MSINVSARKVSLLVGGKDYSAAFVEAKLDTTELNSSGLVTTSGSITLIDVRDLPGVLDDRVGSDWRVGQAVTIDVTNSSGILDRHPVGALRIVSSEYDYETRRLTLRVGCLLTLLSFKHPTEPVEGQAAEVINGSSRLGIVIALLNKAGITTFNCPYKIPYAIAYPIEPSGSYVETAGKILYSAGFFAWVDRFETVQIKPQALSGNSAVTLAIGGDEGQELWYRRLSSPEGPREIIKVVGMKKLASTPQNFSTTETRYGSAKTVDPETSNNTIAIEVKEITAEINGNVVTTTTIISRPAGLVIPNISNSRFQLIIAERIFERKEYDGDTSGKLRLVETTTFRPAGSVFAEYYKYLEDEEADVSGKGNLILAARMRQDYQYDFKERPTSIATTKWETEGALLSGINQDWSEFNSTPSVLLISETSEEKWRDINVNTWRHTISAFKVLARARPELITGDSTKAQKLQLIADDNAAVTLVSNSGQTVPPAPERRPPKVSWVDKRVEGIALVSQHGGNPLKERERTYNIEYLESGVYSSSTDSGYIQNMGVGIGNDEQCASIARLEGHLLYGRFKGQDLGVALMDELFAWQPLMKVDCVEPDGTKRAFALDDAHWFLGSEKALGSFGCVFLGSRANQLKNVDITLTQKALSGTTTLTIVPVSSVIPAHTILSIGGMDVVTTRDVQPGDNTISIVSSPGTLSSGTSATYTEETLNLPFALRIAWDSITPEQWNNMSEESWRYLLATL